MQTSESNTKISGLEPAEAPPQPPGDVLSGLPAAQPPHAPMVPPRFMPRLAPLDGLEDGEPGGTHALFSELSAADTAMLRAR